MGESGDHRLGESIANENGVSALPSWMHSVVLLPRSESDMDTFCPALFKLETVTLTAMVSTSRICCKRKLTLTGHVSYNVELRDMIGGWCSFNPDTLPDAAAGPVEDV